MVHLRQSVLQWIRPLHQRFRNQKLDIFLKLLKNGHAGTLLDVGGGPGITGEFLRLYAACSRVCVVNLEPPPWNKHETHHVKIVLADGCRLPFPPRSFDWVFCNAVIEHVGGWVRQTQFADEIRRVSARGYFVATPNKYFPLEPHTLLPFFQFLPPGIQRRAVRFSPGYVTRYEEIHLVSAGELRQLFPEAEVRSIGTPFLGNNLVAFYAAD